MPPSRRSADKIQELCTQLIRLKKEDGEEFSEIAKQLRAAITKHIDHLRERVSEFPNPNERRKQP